MSLFKKFELKNVLGFYVSLFAFYFGINLLNGVFRKYTPGLYDNITLLTVLSIFFAVIASHFIADVPKEEEIARGGLATAAIIAD